MIVFGKALKVALLVLSIALAPVSGEAAVLKIATLAPPGSDWMRFMREGAKEIRERTEGRVEFKFYAGGVMGNEKKVLRKMRAGQLHGGAFTSGGLAERWPGMGLYGLPLLFRSLDEVDHVRGQMDAVLIEGLEEQGLVSFGFAEGGFARMMSNAPVRDLDDLAGQKVWVPEGDRLSYAAMEALGLAPVTLPLTDVLTGLQTGLLDIIATSPVGAVAFQWHTKLRYLTTLPVAYIVATLAVEKRAFDRLSAADQTIVREVMGDTYRELDAYNRAQEQRALAALQANGIEAVSPVSSQVPRWRAVVAASNRELGKQGAVDLALLDALEAHLAAFRTSETHAASDRTP